MSGTIRLLVREIINEISLKSIGNAAAELTGTEGLFLRDARKLTDYDDRIYTENIDFCDKSLDLNKVINFMIGSNEKTKSVVDLAYRLNDGRILLKLSFNRQQSDSTTKYNDIFSQFGCSRPTDSDLSTSGQVYTALKSSLQNTKALERQIKIASARSISDLMSTEVFNPSLSYYAITKCDNEFLYGLKPHAITGSGIGKSDAYLYTVGLVNFGKWLSHHPIKAYSEIGKTIADLPDDIEEKIVFGLQASSSALGLIDLVAGFLGGAPMIGSIGPSLVLAEYYRYAKPDDKTLGVPTYIMHYVFSALNCIGPYSKVGGFLRTGEEISDLAILANNFAKIRNAMGLEELGAVSSQTAKLLEAKGLSYNSASLHNLYEFSKKFPEVGKTFLQGGSGEFIKQGTGWAWRTTPGVVGSRAVNFLTSEVTGDVIIFSDQVKKFLEFCVRNQNTVSRYVMWFNGMPGFFGKIALYTSYAFDTITIGSIFNLWGDDSSIPEGEISITATPESVSTTPALTIRTDFYSKVLSKNPDLVTLIKGKNSISSPIIFNINNGTKRQIKESDLESISSSLLPILAKSYSQQDNSENINILDAKIILTDSSIYNNFDYIVKNPDYLVRRGQNLNLSFLKHTSGVYSLMMSSTIADIMNK